MFFKKSHKLYSQIIIPSLSSIFFNSGMCTIKRLHAFLAHLSQSLIGELIGYTWSGVVRPSSVHIFKRRKTAWPIKAKFYVEPPWQGGTKVYINGPGRMTKMATMPIYHGKNLKKSSSPEQEVL